MGVAGLWKYLNDNYYIEIFKDICRLEDFAGQRWGIDVSLYMHRLGSDASRSPIPLFLEQAQLLQQAGIQPVYLFDGKRHPTKMFEHARRAEQARKTAENAVLRADVLQRLPALGDVAAQQACIAEFGPAEARRAVTRAPVEMEIAGCGVIEIEGPAVAEVVRAMQCRKAKEDTSVTVFSNALYHELMAAFDMEGIPFYIAVGDAEKLGAYLCKTNQLEALVTDDGDALAFGAPRVIRNLFRSGASGMQYVDLATVLRCLEVTHDQFVDMCILCGCDYTESHGLPTFGPPRALALIKTHHTIVQYLASPDWEVKASKLAASKQHHEFRLEEHFDHAAARAMFVDTSDQIGYASTGLTETPLRSTTTTTMDPQDGLNPAKRKRVDEDDAAAKRIKGGESNTSLPMSQPVQTDSPSSTNNLFTALKHINATSFF